MHGLHIIGIALLSLAAVHVTHASEPAHAATSGSSSFATVAIYASEVFRLSKTTEIWARTQRGFARVQLGDLDGAESDGEAALAVKAGYEPALGLMQLVSYKRKARR